MRGYLKIGLNSEQCIKVRTIACVIVSLCNCISGDCRTISMVCVIVSLETACGSLHEADQLMSKTCCDQLSHRLHTLVQPSFWRSMTVCFSLHAVSIQVPENASLDRLTEAFVHGLQVLC